MAVSGHGGACADCGTSGGDRRDSHRACCCLLRRGSSGAVSGPVVACCFHPVPRTQTGCFGPPHSTRPCPHRKPRQAWRYSGGRRCLRAPAHMSRRSQMSGGGSVSMLVRGTARARAWAAGRQCSAVSLGSCPQGEAGARARAVVSASSRISSGCRCPSLVVCSGSWRSPVGLVQGGQEVESGVGDACCRHQLRRRSRGCVQHDPFGLHHRTVALERGLAFLVFVSCPTRSDTACAEVGSVAVRPASAVRCTSSGGVAWPYEPTSLRSPARLHSASRASSSGSGVGKEAEPSRRQGLVVGVPACQEPGGLQWERDVGGGHGRASGWSGCGQA